MTTERDRMSATQLLELAKAGTELTDGERARLSSTQKMELPFAAIILTPVDRQSLSSPQLMELEMMGADLVSKEIQRLSDPQKKELEERLTARSAAAAREELLLGAAKHDELARAIEQCEGFHRGKPPEVFRHFAAHVDRFTEADIRNVFLRCDIRPESARGIIAQYLLWGDIKETAHGSGRAYLMEREKKAAYLRELSEYRRKNPSFAPPPGKSQPIERPRDVGRQQKEDRPVRRVSKVLPSGWLEERQLGEGGGGPVYLATHESAPERRVALKMLGGGKPKVARDRFAREVEAARQLDHPSIVKMLGHDLESDKPFYWMEYFEGAESLLRLMRRGRNPFAGDEVKCVRMVIAILEGLKCCEQAGLAHRDLSPANILVLPDETIKIIDFGLCHFTDSDRVTLTRTDENLGTPNYMAPECESHSGQEIGIQADFYSTGKILWSAMVNQGAFAREEPAFASQSMRARFPLDPNAWHLQDVFEKTIRHAPAARWKNSEDALVDAWRVLDLVRTRTLPVEALSDRCFVCRVGRFVSAESAFEVGGYLLFGESQPQGISKRCCNHCGFCCIVNRRQQEETIARRRSLS